MRLLIQGLRIAPALAVCGCTQRFKQVLAMGHVALIVLMSGLTVVGGLALRGALRDLKTPERTGRAALAAITALFTLALPSYLLAIYGDEHPTVFNLVVLGMVIFTFALFVLFVLALVRTVRGR